MRRSALCGLAFGGLATLSGCQFLPFGGDTPAPAPASAATPVAAPKPVQPAKPVTPPLAGGYAATTCEESVCKEAQALAVQTIYRQDPQRGVVEATTVEQQVVAGMNYRFHITMTGPQKYSITVYRDLQGNMTISNFAKEVGRQ